MARLARAEVFDSSEIAIVHVMNRVVRRCFLFGDDPISGKNFDHRKVWIEDQVRLQAACFGIDLLGFALMPNQQDRYALQRQEVSADVAGRLFGVIGLDGPATGAEEERPDSTHCRADSATVATRSKRLV